MAEHIKRLRVLAGLVESESYLSREEAEDMDDAEYDKRTAREAKIVKLIDRVCKKLDIPIERERGEPSGIYYDEESGREASIRLDDIEITATKIAGLLQSGLSDDFRIFGTSDGISIDFIVHPGLDGAI